ncbi:MAG TPA: helix-hairpin-helix domain-containing protein [Anaerolineales bacterium]|nr:helix-hairpin-helix domain-containing protein [Anaerolineales bacterium]
MQTLKSILYLASGILFGLFLAALIWVVARNPSGEAVLLRPAPTEKPLIVYITGAVPRPGVYALPKDARVQDAISAAGGFLAEAEKSQINLAALLEDGEKLDVPYIEGGSPVLATPGPTIEAVTTELININTASIAELDTLPGIGPTTAQKVIDYREQNGPFVNTEDIINVSGIGPGTYERIKDLITVGP